MPYQTLVVRTVMFAVRPLVRACPYAPTPRPRSPKRELNLAPPMGEIVQASGLTMLEKTPNSDFPGERIMKAYSQDHNSL